MGEKRHISQYRGIPNNLSLRPSPGEEFNSLPFEYRLWLVTYFKEKNVERGRRGGKEKPGKNYPGQMIKVNIINTSC